MGPPAAMLYAVLPVGVAMISPSACMHRHRRALQCLPGFAVSGRLKYQNQTLHTVGLCIVTRATCRDRLTAPHSQDGGKAVDLYCGDVDAVNVALQVGQAGGGAPIQEALIQDVVRFKNLPIPTSKFSGVVSQNLLHLH